MESSSTPGRDGPSENEDCTKSLTAWMAHLENLPKSSDFRAHFARIVGSNHESVDPSVRRWKKIGREVYLRKTLLLAATEELKLRGIEDKAALRLAATDVFVEKAQQPLLWRGSFLIVGGGIAGLLAVAISIVAAYLILSLPLDDILGNRELNGHLLTLLVVKASTAGVLLITAVGFLIYAAKASLHEGVSAFNRRHALRFGRVYVYLKDGNVDFKELEEAFWWNKPLNTGFKTIRHRVARTPVEKVVNAVRDGMRDFANAIRPGSVGPKE
jgi:hypothetical protein